MLEEPVTDALDRVVLTDFGQAPNHVGAWVTIKGEVSRTKIPQIIGVDVDIHSGGEDLRGRWAQASGILETWTWTQQEIDAAWAEHGPFATRGPGQYFRLVQPGPGGKLAVATTLDPPID